MRLAVQAMQNCGTLTGNLADDRACVRDGMAEITNFDGITGEMTFAGTNDPVKCAVIVQILGDDVVFYDSACP